MLGDIHMLTKYSGNYKIETSVDFRRADGSAAALVALVAPHGAGKTSIREGVELALTGEIQTPTGTVPVTSLGARGAFGARPVSVHVTGEAGHAGAVIQARKLLPEGSGVYADPSTRRAMAVRQAFDERLLSGKLAGSAAELARAFTVSFGAGTQSRVDGQPTVLDETKLASDYGALAPGLSETFRKVAAAAHAECVRLGIADPSDSDILTKMQEIIASSQTKVQGQIRELRATIEAQTSALETVRAHASTTVLGPEILPDMRKRHAAALAWERAPVSDDLIAQHEATLARLESELIAQQVRLSELDALKSAAEMTAEQETQKLMAESDVVTKEFDAVCTRQGTDATLTALREKRQTVANVVEVTQACLLVAQRMRDFASRGSDAARKCPITGRATEPNEWAQAVVRCEARLVQAHEAHARAQAALEAHMAPLHAERQGYESRLSNLGTQLRAVQERLELDVSALERTKRDVDATVRTIQSSLTTTRTTIAGLRDRKRAMPPDYEHSSKIAQTIKLIEAHALLASDTANEALKIEQLQAQIERMKAVSTFCTHAAQGLLARIEAQIVDRLNVAAQRTRPMSATDSAVSVERGTQGLIFGMRLRNPRVLDDAAPNAWHFVPYDALSGYQRTVLSLLVAIETSLGSEKILLLDDDALGALDDNAFVQLLDLLASKVTDGALTQVILATARVELFDPTDATSAWSNRDLWFAVMPQTTVRARAEQKLSLDDGSKSPDVAAGDLVQSLFAEAPSSVSSVDADVFADMF